MSWTDELKGMIGDHAKDIRLNIDAVLLRSNLAQDEAAGCALAAAFAAGNKTVVDMIKVSGALTLDQINGALSAASLMAMNNVYYPYVEMAGDHELHGQKPELRMNVYATYGGVGKKQFEMYALAASIVGKCNFCVKSHYDLLRKEGLTVIQLRDVGRIASVINAVCKVIDIA
jgi:alkyl hydroperoxide reductase subunit D